ncbi:MAG: hypothetical protein GY769_04955, partial [bacterium]|nr:hypothetical protein [bacterium]
GKREIIRRSISTNVLEFTRLISDLAEVLEQHTGKRVLCVLDGLDHVDAGPAFELLNGHFQTLTLPKISKVFIVPLTLLNTPFLATIGGRYSTVPNIKVFRDPRSKELDDAGFGFFKNVVSRYVSLELFSEEALASLCRLSAGILRDMIDNTSAACAAAVDADSPRVTEEHVEPVWHRVMRFYMNQLRSQDYEVLQQVEENPQLEQGTDGVPPLLHNKAIVFYPNGRGWFGTHPAVRRMMAEPAERH